MYRVLTIVLFLCIASICRSQAPGIEWQHSFGGSDIDCAYSILQTSDGGYIALGHSGSVDGDVTGNHGDLDYWVVKFDSKGKLEWQHSYGGSGIEEAYCIKQTLDGNYIIAGYSSSDDGDVTDHKGSADHYDCWIVKIDAAGNIIWKKSYGGSDDDLAYSVCPTADGGYVFTGYTFSSDGDITSNHSAGTFLEDLWVVKIDGQGKLIWQRTMGGTSQDEGYGVEELADGTIAIAGFTQSTDGDVTPRHGSTEAWVINLDADGKLLWNQTYGGSRSDNAYSIEQTNEGGFIVAGTTASTDGDLSSAHGAGDFFILKLDNTGLKQWARSLGGSQGEWSYIARQTSDGGYIASGTGHSSDGDETGYHADADSWVTKLDANGQIEWENSYGGQWYDEAYDIVETIDGGFIFTGSALSDDGDVIGHHDPANVSDFWVVKLLPQTIAEPTIAGFPDIPATLSCLSAIDSVHILFPRTGSFEIVSVSIGGADKNNFQPGSIPSGTITVTGSRDLAIPITFSNGTQNRTYTATADITVRNISTGKEYVFTVPISAFSFGTLSIAITAQLANPMAYAGDDVVLPLHWSHAPKQSGIALDALNIRELSFDFAFNTDLLIIDNNDFASAFVSNLSGWSCDGLRSTIDETAKTLHLVLVGNSALPDTTDLLGELHFKATLTANDTSTPFRMTACSVLTASQQNLIGSCGTLTSTSDTTFTELPQCGDSYIRKILRNETIQPFSITTSSNPVTTNTVTLICKSNIAGALEGTLFNMMGVAVKPSWASAMLKKGENRITGSVGDLPAGVYYYVFGCDGYRVSGRLVIAN